ncbi:Uncharacterised protein [Shigella sonnei]|nr:Uncharacterised protein [Shigella sonnei]
MEFARGENVRRFVCLTREMPQIEQFCGHVVAFQRNFQIIFQTRQSFLRCGST